MKYTLFACIILLVGCAKPNITARSFYTSRTDLASYVLDTPDPLKSTKGLGQIIWVRWNMACLSDSPIIDVRIQFTKGQERHDQYPVTSKNGWLFIEIPHNEREQKGDMQSYRIQIRTSDKVLASTQHKMWIEKITINDSNEQ